MIIIGQVRGYKTFATYFDLFYSEEIEVIPHWNIQQGENLFVIKTESPRELSRFCYGMPGKDNQVHYEAAIEGESNDRVLKKRILNDPKFRMHIRHRRCAIPIDYFVLVENERAYLFFSFFREQLSIAGIFNSGEHQGVALLTVPAYGMFKQLGFKRSPMLIRNRSKRWLTGQHLADITSLMVTYPDKDLNGYRVSREKFLSKKNSKEAALPQGPFLKERSLSFIPYKKDKPERSDDKPWGPWADLKKG